MFSLPRFESIQPKITGSLEKSFFVYVYKNGNNFLGERKRILVKQWMLKNWNTFLAELTAVNPLINGAIYS